MSDSDDYKYKNYIYTVFGNNATCIAAMEAQGIHAPYPGASTNGMLFIADIGNKIGAVCEMAPPIPSYVTPQDIEEFFQEWPYIHYEDANKLQSYMASSEGASDGFTYNDPNPIK